MTDPSTKASRAGGRRPLSPEDEAEQRASEAQSRFQDAATEAALARYAAGFDRARIQAGTGAGKSGIIPRLIKGTGATYVLILVPNVTLVGQVLRDYGDENAIGFCSKREIAAAAKDDQDVKVFPCANTVEEVAGARLVVATYQSVKKLKGKPFDLCIYDEAHRASAKTFGEPLAWPDIKKHFLMTATDRKIAGDDEKYGECVFRYPFPETVRDTVTVPLRVRIEVSRGVHGTVDAPDPLDWTKNAFERHRGSGEITTAISFHRFVDDAKRMAEMVKRAALVCGDSSRAELPRDEAMQRFAGGIIHLLTNVSVLAEGVDVPRVDAIFFTCKSGSEEKVSQAAGRASRRCRGKEYGLLFLPVYVGNEDEVDFRSSDFRQLVKILRHLIEGGQLLKMEIEKFARGEPSVTFQVTGAALTEQTARGIAAAIDRTIEEPRPFWQNAPRVRMMADIHGGIPLPGDDIDTLIQRGFSRKEVKYLLGWVNYQKSRYDGDDDMVMPPDEAVFLESIKGWEWRTRLGSEKHHVKMSRVSSTSQSRPQVKAAVGARTRAAWSSDEYREKMNKARPDQTTPEARARFSERAKASHARPEVRQNISAKTKIALNTPEVKARLSAAQRALSDDVKQRRAAAAKAALQKPEVKARIGAASKAYHTRPDVKAKLSARSKARFTDEAVRQTALANLAQARVKQLKAVVAIDVNGVEQRFGSIAEAARSLGLNQSNISCCARGKSASCGGYRWTYA